MKHNTIKGLEDLLRGNGAESRWLTDAFHKSNRIQAVIGLHFGDTVNVELIFYAPGEEEPLFSMNVPFTFDEANVVGSGMRIPGTPS